MNNSATFLEFQFTQPSLDSPILPSVKSLSPLYQRAFLRFAPFTARPFGFDLTTNFREHGQSPPSAQEGVTAEGQQSLFKN